jgi:D-tagatose-1,6-bisphosphate aldolase subunit GatZ/KbaZ
MEHRMPISWDDLAETASNAALLAEVVAANLRRANLGIYSICSANHFVLEAGMRQAARDGTVLLVESTSNQVNQFGGYTRMTPSDFCDFVRSVADAVGFPGSRIVLGGDHVGPHVWRAEPAEAAMAKASRLVGDCVVAGYTKLHIDASMPLRDDPSGGPIDDWVISERAAVLVQAAEAAWARLPPNSPRPVYVVGSEVPIPGGEMAGQAAPTVTAAEDVERTLLLVQQAFVRRGLEAAWERVIAVVVQPGVEFGDELIFEYDRAAAGRLSAFLERDHGLVYEAHSTDYQLGNSLREMVEDHFAVLKVGPGLTFAAREAVYALEVIEREWLGRRSHVTLSHLRETLHRVMVDHPEHWLPYYRGSQTDLRFARDYSFSDRSRYYWRCPEVQAAIDRLLSNLRAGPVPLTLLSQYLPAEYRAVRTGTLRNEPREMILHRIADVLDGYAEACGMR